MANISSGASGPWSSPSTWTGGVVPGAADNVTIAGHVVTVDQNVTITNLTASGVAYIDFPNSTAYTFTSTGTITINMSSLYLFRFPAAHTAAGTTLTFNIVNAGYSGSTALGVVGFATGATGNVICTMNTFTGDGTTAGLEPSMFWYEQNSGISLNVSFLACTLNSSFFVEANRAGNIDHLIVNTNNAPIGAPSAIFVYVASNFVIGTFTINGNIGSGTGGSIGNIVLAGLANRSMTINGDIIGRMGTVSLSGTDGGSVTINGNVTHFPGVTAQVLSTGSLLTTINGNVISLSTSGTSALMSGTNLRINGNVTSGMAGPAISGDTNTSIIILGLAYSGQTYTLTNQGSGVAIFGNVRYTPGNNYIIKVPSATNWPAWTGAPVTLDSTGEGPDQSDVRAGEAYPTGMKGTANVPEPQSVRAGVAVDASVGVALVDNADLANITGGQIATLSE